MDPRSIVFVYNADSGVVNALLDLMHKVVSPKTYDCNLCGITFSPLGMRKEWRRFVAGLGLPATFLRRDELRESYGRADDLPAVFLESESGLQELAGADALNACRSLTELQGLIRDGLVRQPVGTSTG